MRGNTKRSHTLQRIRRIFDVAVIAAAVLGLSTCDLLKPGLGDEVDIDPPKISVESHSNGDYVGGSFTLSGTVEDDFRVDSVTVSDGTDTFNAALDGETWSVKIDSSSLNDGDVDYQLNVTDASGKNASINLLLTVDNNPPTVLVTTPDLYGNDAEFNNVVTIKGEAADTTRVKEVLLSLYDRSDDSAVFTDVKATGTSSWYYSFDASSLDGGLNGEYYLIVRAYDNSGNFNPWFYHFADIRTNADDVSDLPNIEDINAYEYGGETLPGTLNVSLASLRHDADPADHLMLNVNPDSDMPQFGFYSPSETGSNPFASPQRFNGFVEDDDGPVASAEVKIFEYTSYVNYDDAGGLVEDSPLTLEGSNWSYESDLPSGNDYYIQLRATDINGLEATSQPVRFSVPEGVPGLVIQSPQQGKYVGTGETLDFQFDITNLNSGRIEIDVTPGDDDWSDAIELDPASAYLTSGNAVNGTYETSITAGTDFTLGNGSQSFKIRAGVDGGWGQSTYSFVGDTVQPTMSLTYPNEYSQPSDAVNGIISISGIADDGLNPLKAVYGKIESGIQAAQPAPASFDGSWLTPSGLANWTRTGIDTTDPALFPDGDGDYTLRFFVVDAAGNVSDSSSSVRHIRVDQSSDIPVISYSNIQSGGTAADNILGNGASIFGKVNDDDAVDADTVQIRIDVYNDGAPLDGEDITSDGDILDTNESEDWVNVSNQPDVDGGEVTWAHSLENLPQGVHSFQVRSEDINGTVGQSSAWIPFTLDFGPPSIIITSPVPAAVSNGSDGDSDGNYELVITGTASDPNGIEEVRLYIDSVEIPAGTGNLEIVSGSYGDDVVTWRYEMPVDRAANSDDGDYSMEVQADDFTTGPTKTNSETRQFTIDTLSPELVVTNPVNGEYVEITDYDIRGQITDNGGAGVDSLEYSLDSSDGSDGTWTPISLGGLNWTVADVDFSSGGQGAKTLWVRASDGLNDPSLAEVDFFYDTADPVLSESGAPGETNTDFTLSGSASDTNAFGSLEIRAEKDGADQGVIFTTAGSGAFSHPVTLPGDGTDDGEWVYTLTAEDVAGRTTELTRTVVIDETAPESLSFDDPGDYVSGNVVSLLGSAGDSGSGLASLGSGGVEYSLDSTDGTDGSWSAVSGSPSSWNFSVDLDIDGAGADTGLAEGSHSAWVRARDKAGNLAPAVEQIFVVDQSAPFVSNLEEDGGADWGDVILYKAADFTISGTANDTNGVSSVAVTQSKDGGAAADIFSATGVLNGADGDSSRTWSVDTDISAGEGSYVYVITLTDSVGRQNSVQKEIVVDSSAPNAPGVSDPAADQWLSGSSYAVQGSATDNGAAGIDSVYYRVGARGSSPTTDLSDSGWQPASGTTSWNATISLSGEGERSLFVIAVDNSGNQSAMTTHDFGIDQNAPTISIDGGLSTMYRNAGFSISGDAADSNAVDRIEVEEKIGAGTYSSAGTASFDSGTGDWSYTRTIDGGDSDDVYTYRFTVYDAAGKTAVVEKDVNLDRVAPSISFNNPDPYIDSFDGDPLPQAGRIYANGEMDISGSITENGGVGNLSSLEYSIDGGGSWTALTLGSTFDITGVDSSAVADGSDLDVSVRAIDRNGNSASSTQTLRVYQDSDKPVLNISAPTDGETISSQTINVSGTVSDDDGVGVNADSVQYRFSSDGGGTWGSWTNVSTTGSVTDRSFSFSFSSATDGPKAIELRAEDNNPTPVNSDVFTRSFTQDTGAPTLSGLTPANFSYQNGDFTVSGTADDSNGVDTVDIRILRDNVEIQAFTSTSLTGSSGDASRDFDYTVDTSAGDGLYQVILRSQDLGGNTREDSRQVYVDTTAPTAEFTTDFGSVDQNNSISINGSSSDAYGVQNLDVVVVDVNNAGAEMPLPTGTVSGTTLWTLSNLDTRNSTLLNYALDLGGGQYELTLRVRAEDEAGNAYSTSGTDDLTFTIDQSSDAPQVSIDGIAFDGSSSVTSPVISGTVSDDDGVSQIIIDSYAVDDSVTSETVTLTGAGYGAETVDWEITLSNTENGVRGIRVRSVDTVDNNGSDYSAMDYSRTDTGRIDFSLDTELPDAAVSGPANGTIWSSNDSFDFAGTSGDESGIVSLKYKFDDSDLSSGTTLISTPYDNWSFSVAQGSLADGAHTVYIQATDGVGNTRIASRAFTVDKTAPSISITSPADGSAVFGPLTIGGTTADNSGGAGVDNVSIGLGKQIDPTNASTLEASTWIDTGGTTSWSYSFLNINDYANSTFAVNTGDLDGDGVEDAGETWTDLWDFTVYVRAEDSAGLSGDGNVNYLTSYTLQIDPKRDRPEVTILSPDDGATVGGFVRVFGSAFDSQFVEKVQIAIDADNDGDYTNDSWSEGTLDETSDGVNWYQVNGTDSWNINLNENSEFDPSVGSTRTIGIRVRAKDYKQTPGDGIYGAEEEISITFNKDFPQFEGMTLVSGDTVSGTYLLSGLVRDETDIDRIIFSNEGPLLDNTVIFDNPGGLLPPGAANTTGLETAAAAAEGITVELLGTGDPDYDGAFPGSYRISIPINTEAAGLYNNGAGSMSVKVTAEDTTSPSPFTNQNLISFSVDNITPSDLAVTGSTEIIGTAAELQGTVRDTGTVAGIDRVVLYLTDRNGDLIQLKNGSGTTSSFTAADVYDLDNPAFDDYRIVIDNELESGAAGSDGLPSGDGDGFDERLALSAGTYQWSALFDSTAVNDGAVTLHSRAVDFAGNFSEAAQAAFIANNKPAINSLVLGTDLDASGTVEADEQGTTISSGYGSSNFTARNDLLYIAVNSAGGNGTLRYSIVYNGTEQNGALTDSAVEIDTSAFTESSSDNDQTIEITVYDSTTSDDADSTDELSAAVTLGLTIDNVDDTAPNLDIAPFGQGYNEDADDTQKALQPVTDYEENIAMSGDTRLGHVEYAADSLHDGTDADISGRVIIQGKAWDNQIIDRIDVSIPGYNGGTAFTVFGSGAGTSPDWSFTVDGSEYLNEDTGNVFNWDFEFDSSRIANVAENNVVLSFDIFDAGGNSVNRTMQVDVVPYISSIIRPDGAENTFRSRFGKFILRENEAQAGREILITGYNLAETGTSWVRVYNDDRSANDDLGAANYSANTEATHISITDSSNLTHSGWLSVMVNGIESINNRNGSSRDWQKEDDGSGLASTLWTDDRYVQMWNYEGSFDQSLSPVHPAMEADRNTWQLWASWSYYATSDMYSAAMGPVVNRTSYFSIYDPPEWTDILVAPDGSRHITYLQNYYNGGNAWGYLVTENNNGNVAYIERLGNGDADTPNYADGEDETLYQFQNPRIVRDEVNGRNYVSYYDAYSKTLKYAITDGANEIVATNGGNETSGATVVAGVEDTTASPTSSGEDVGVWSSIAVDSIGGSDATDVRPVIIFYNTTQRTLQIARGNTPEPANSSEWTVTDVFPAADTNDDTAGYYVDMKLDASGNIHAVAHRVSTGDLLYLYAPNIDGTGSYTFQTSEIIDSEGAVGSWADMDLAGDTPYVSYLTGNGIGTFSGLKMAYYDSTLGAWEYGVVATNSIVNSQRTSIVARPTSGAWVTSTAGKVAIGYGSGNYDLVILEDEE
ncbi:beta strand repeat-containing protein [Salinispira pacifica]|nr:Ig-like domain-containing protein [Salinispira pacifica]